MYDNQVEMFCHRCESPEVLPEVGLCLGCLEELEAWPFDPEDWPIAPQLFAEDVPVSARFL